MKRKMMIALMVLLMAVCAVGCGGKIPGDDDIEPVDPSKAQLYVCNFNGGYGNAWLELAIKRFQEKYAGYEFTKGTKGVQVYIDNVKSDMTALVAQISNSRNDVYFLENVNYQDYVLQGVMLDISEIVTQKLTEYGETESIEDKLTSAQKAYYKTSSGKYYGLPHYEGYNGIMYDVDLFDQKNLFFSSTGEINLKSTSPNLSAGPNGIPGDYDDGLPATYADFYRLCDRMVEIGITPISWSGNFQFYITNMIYSLETDYEGLEQAMLNYTLDGNATKLASGINEDGTVNFKEPTQLTEQTGYLTYSQAGRYYALSFLYNLIKNEYYSSKSFNTAQSHTDAQDDFLFSRFESSMKTIGMLAEGVWWEEEADDTFTEMAEIYPKASRAERRIGFMPYPKATSTQIGEKLTLVDNNYALSFVNGYIDESRKELATKFLQFCCTDESLIEFTKTTGTSKGFQYTLSDDDFKDLDYFAKSVMTARQNADVVYPYSSSPFFYRNYNIFISTTMYAYGNYSYPSSAFKYNSQTAVSYFNGLKSKYTPSVWEALCE